MKYTTLLKKRKELVNKTNVLSINSDDDIVFNHIQNSNIIKEFYTPAGFKFLTNIGVDIHNMRLNEYGKKKGQKLSQYLRYLRNKYGDVQVGDAFDCYGRHIDGVSPFLPYERELEYAIYVKEE